MRLLASLLVACLAACADDSATDMLPLRTDAGPTPDAAEEPGPDAMTCPGVSVQLGTGVREFVAVKDGDTVYLYRGPQGGYMIYLSVRAAGLDPKDINLCYTEKFQSTGITFGEGCWRIMLTNDLGDGRYERVGVWGQIDSSWWTRSSTVRGSDVKVDATLTDSAGCTAKAGWRVHISDTAGT